MRRAIGGLIVSVLVYRLPSLAAAGRSLERQAKFAAIEIFTVTHRTTVGTAEHTAIAVSPHRPSKCAIP